MKQRYLILFFLISLVEISFSQDSEFLRDFEYKQKKNEGKDFHQRQALTLDELLLKNKGLQANTIRKKRNYIVYEYLVTAKRKPYYEGDIFRFRYEDGHRYDLQLEFIDDSSFVTSYFDSISNTFENKVFDVNGVKKVYFRSKRKITAKRIGVGLLTPLGFAVMAFLGNSEVDPITQIQTIAIFYGGIAVGTNLYRAATNSRRMRNNRRVRILKSY